MKELHLLLLGLPWLTLGMQHRASRRAALLCCACSLGLGGLNLQLGLIRGSETADELTLWLLPYASLIYLVLFLFVPRSERSPQLTRALLAGMGLDQLFFSVSNPLALAVLWSLSYLPLWSELGHHRNGARLRKLLLVFHLPGCALFLLGSVGFSQAGAAAVPQWAILAIVSAIVLRKAIFPVHQWLPALLEHGPFGALIAFVCPQLSAYVAARLLSPNASEEVLVWLGGLALFTSVYGACLALGQRSLRGIYASLFMGQTSLVFAGLQCTSAAGLAGGLAVWISGGLALTGLAVTMWAMEARRGRIWLHRFHGGYERSPVLAGAYLIFGLTAVGFPGTLGFLSQELLLDGTMHVYPHVGILAALTAALNGLTVLYSFFRLFCGSRANYEPTQNIRRRERLAVVLLLFVLIGAGLAPQAFLASRTRIAAEVVLQRARHGLAPHN